MSDTIDNERLKELYHLECKEHKELKLKFFALEEEIDLKKGEIRELENENEELEDKLSNLERDQDNEPDEMIQTLEDELKMDLIKEVFQKYTLAEFEQRLK